MGLAIPGSYESIMIMVRAWQQALEHQLRTHLLIHKQETEDALWIEEAFNSLNLPLSTMPQFSSFPHGYQLFTKY